MPSTPSRWRRSRSSRRSSPMGSPTRSGRAGSRRGSGAGRLKRERLGPPLLAEHERELLRRLQAVGVRGTERRTRLLLGQRAQHLLVEEAILAARLALAAA